MLTPFRAGRARTISLQLDNALGFGVFGFIDPAELGIATRIHVNFHKPFLFEVVAIGSCVFLLFVIVSLRCDEYSPLSLVLLSLTTLSEVISRGYVRTAESLSSVFE